MDAVYRLAYHLPGHPEGADDLVLETYRIALTSDADFEPTEQNVRAWLFKILYDAAIRLSRTASPTPPAPAAQAGGSASLGLGPPLAVPDLSAVNWDRAEERLRRTIRDLSLAHRAAFLLCMVENLKYRDAAGVMGVPVGEVVVLLDQARAALSARVAGPAPDRPDAANPLTP